MKYVTYLYQVWYQIEGEMVPHSDHDTLCAAIESANALRAQNPYGPIVVKKVSYENVYKL